MVAGGDQDLVEVCVEQVEELGDVADLLAREDGDLVLHVAQEKEPGGVAASGVREDLVGQDLAAAAQESAFSGEVGFQSQVEFGGGDPALPPFVGIDLERKGGAVPQWRRRSRRRRGISGGSR